VDVLVDHTRQVRAAIIDFGGFLGVGTRKIAVDWRAIRFAPDGNSDHIMLSLTRNEVRVAPEYKQGEPIVVLGPSTKPSAPPPNTSAVPPKAAPSK
jgi:PRC-barrel domain